MEIDVDSLTDLDERVALPHDIIERGVMLLDDESRVSNSFREAAEELDLTQVQFSASISIRYSSDSELLLRVLNFGFRSRNTYARHAGFSWRLGREERDGQTNFVVTNLSTVDNE